ncbi:hypothetical protein G3570_06630 [Balneolaceae bacterium YR4-1]|uniref:Uncharacterized protein n=1 Tax=Halalkalibaculum roseum TaxID=2709311 RepID=A0A6M1STP9_9BACT|nr:hypothetical protein [Halalkalibaculum roseum]NGP76300.1 hypothetical protein [Halalkalibaculum roseum]
MTTKEKWFPEDWEYSSAPNLYYYNGLKVKRVEQDQGKVELITRDRNHTRHSVLAEGLREAMKKMEARL